MALGFMRRHRGWLKYMLLFVVLAFIIVYIPLFQDADAGGPGEVLARVGEESVTAAEFQRAYVRERQRLGSGIDPAMLERLGFRDQVLQALIDRKLVVQEAERLGLEVDDETVAREIAQAPAFQSRGRFLGADEIRRQLALQGRNEEEFTESVREELLVRRLQALVTDGVRVTEQEAEREFRRRNEQVKVEYVQVEAAPFRAQVSADESEITARFQSQRESYRIPERRVLGYLLLDPAALQAQAQVSDAEIQAYYSQNDEQFQQAEESCARHILFKVKANPEAAGHSEDEARALAARALEQVRGGADFAAVATNVSEDAGSASQGGDLGCFGRGRMVAEFDEAAFSLPVGQVSDPVRTQHGIHLIQVTSRKESTTRPLAEVREGIRQTLLAGKTRSLAEEKAAQIGEAIRDGDSLEAAGKAQGLTMQKSAALARTDTTPPLDAPELLGRAFTLQRGQSHPEPFATSRGWVFVTVLEVQPSRLPELAEVKERVRGDIVDQKARALARARAQELYARAQTGTLAAAASGLGLERKEMPAPAGRGEPLADLGASRALEEAAFALPVQGLSQPVPTDAGFAVLRVLEKTPFDPAAFAQQKASLISSLEQQQKQQLFQSYLERARERFPVERRPEALRRLSS